MKRIITVVLAVVMSLSIFAFASCSKENEVVLRILHYRPEDQDFFDWFHDEFTEEYPNVTIEYDAVSTQTYSTVLQARMSAAESNPAEIDIFGIQSGSLVSEESVNRLHNLNDYTTLWDKIPQNIGEANSIDGKRMILPMSVNKEVVFYNKNMFTTLGLTPPTTWTDFIAVLDTLKASVGQNYSVAGKSVPIKAPILFGGLENWPISMVLDALEATTIRQEYPDIYHDIVSSETDVDFNHPLFLEVIQKMQVITKYFQPYSTGFTYALAPGEFSKGNYGLYIDGDWSLASIRYAEPEFEIGTFVLPGNENPEKNKYAATKLGGAALGIYSGSIKKDWAVTYLEMLMSDECYSEYLSITKMGSVKSNFVDGDVSLEDVKDSIPVVPFSSYSCNQSYNLRFAEVLSPDLINGTLSAQQVYEQLYTYVNSTNWRMSESIAQWERMYPRPE